MENFHLVHDDGVYKLKKENAQRASKIMDTNKPKAINSARDFIQNQGGGSLKIQKNDGGFQENRTYPSTNDPKQSKG